MLMLSKYAALVKNLRGVLLANPKEEGVQESLSWLLKRFKYRDLALPPSLSSLRKARGFKRLLELVYPAEELEVMAKLFSSHLNAPVEASETAILASTYVSPIIAVGGWASEALQPLAVHMVRSNVELDNRGWKLHFRIADYTVLDSYNWSVTHAEKLWNPKVNLEEFRSERLKRIEKDARRYWRLSQGEGEGEPLILYLDLAYLAAGNPKLLREVRRLRVEGASAGLALEVAVLVPRGLK